VPVLVATDEDIAVDPLDVDLRLCRLCFSAHSIFTSTGLDLPEIFPFSM
jgi:hypothetical protein